MTVLYHNPRCSKSRQAVALCESSSIDVEIHFYLTNPLGYEVLHSLLSRLEGELHHAIRWQDKAYKEMDDPVVDRTSIDSIAFFLSKNGHLRYLRVDLERRNPQQYEKWKNFLNRIDQNETKRIYLKTPSTKIINSKYYDASILKVLNKYPYNKLVRVK